MKTTIANVAAITLLGLLFWYVISKADEPQRKGPKIDTRQYFTRYLTNGDEVCRVTLVVDEGAFKHIYFDPSTNTPTTIVKK